MTTGSTMTVTWRASVLAATLVYAAACWSTASAEVCCPGGACTLVLGAGSPAGTPGEATHRVRTFLEGASFEQFTGGPSGQPESVLGVDIRIEDPTYAEIKVNESYAGLLDAQGKRVSGLVGPPEYRATPEPKPDGPRVLKVHLRFEPPPADAPEPILMDLRLDRYEYTTESFEWRNVGPNPLLPIEAEQGGIGLAIQEMLIDGEEPVGGGQNGEPHLVVKAEVSYYVPEMSVPPPSFAAMNLIADKDRRFMPSRVTTKLTTEPARKGGVVCLSEGKVTYHFDDLGSRPLFRDIVLQVRKARRVPELFVHAIPVGRD